MTFKKYISILLGLTTITTLALASIASAASISANVSGRGDQHWPGKMDDGRQGILGTVMSINGNLLVVKTIVAGKTVSSNTYTVDATDAKITKNNIVGNISNIAVGDIIRVQGSLTGTTLIATMIQDGMPKPVIQGNGQPIVAGKITTISGNTLTITNNSNVIYIIDATNAKVMAANTISSLSVVSVGDVVIVQGTVNGNSVTASSIVDQKIMTTPNTPKPQGMMGRGGYMGGLGNFFKHLFGF